MHAPFCSYRSFSLLLILLMGWSTLSAQTDSTSVEAPPSAADPRIQTADSLLGLHLAPLDTLMARAIANSTELRGQASLIQARHASLKAQKMTWTKMFQPYVGASFGTGSIAANVDDGTGAVFNLSTRQTLLYNVGITVRFTAEDILNRKNRARIFEHEIDKLHHDSETLERLIRERVIMRYEELLKAAEVLAIKAQQMHTNAVNWEIAERYFHSGDMSYADFNGVLDDKLHSHMQFVNLRSDFQKQYLLLREVVAGPLD